MKFFEDIWKGIKAAFDFGWLNDVASFFGFGGGGADAGGSPSMFAPSAAAGGGGGGRRGAGNANITVDFRNMPRGIRTETRADSVTDLEVTTGYAMQGAQ